MQYTSSHQHFQRSNGKVMDQQNHIISFKTESGLSAYHVLSPITN